MKLPSCPLLNCTWGIVVGLSAQTPAAAQTLGGAADDAGPSWWRVASAFLLCVVLAIAGAFALRSRLGRGPAAGPQAAFRALLDGMRSGATHPTDNPLQVLGSLRLTHQTDVFLLRCGASEFVLTATPHGAQLTPAAPKGSPHD